MKILIADDDRFSRHLLSSRLRTWGYEVHIAHDGLEAWGALREPDGPRLAILDWVMPGIDGAEVCRRVRAQAQEPYIYLMLLTARGRRQDVVTGIDAGADDYLVKPFDEPELRVRLGAAARVVSLQTELVKAREALRFQANHDALTQLPNRIAITGELERAARTGGSMAVAMIDIDHFKRINDLHGHPAGDAVIREVGRRLAASLREGDMVGRFGGEEFLAVLPGCDTAEAVRVGERMRAAVAAAPVVGRGLHVEATVSVGVAAFRSIADPEGFVALADTALYRAKRAGRNRVELVGAIDPAPSWMSLVRRSA